MTLVLRYAARSDRGLVRANNEDSVYAGARLLALADGMGGHAAGEVASQLVVAALAHLDDDEPGGDILGKLDVAVRDGNAAIAAHVRAEPDLEGMGTTLTAILFAGSRLGLAHVGDSRGYLLRDGELVQITKDDTFVQTLVDEGRITAEEAHSHPQRSLIMRALTGHEVEPTLTMREARVGDRYLLCSDGLSDPVSHETILDALKIPDVADSADRLIEMALRGGGPDNVTVVVADVVDYDYGQTQPILAGAVSGIDEHAAPPNTAAGRASAFNPKRNVVKPVVAEPEPPSKKSWSKRRWITGVALLILIAVAGLGIGRMIVRSYYYVSAYDGKVSIMRGVEGSLAGIPLQEVNRVGCLDSNGVLSLHTVDDTSECQPFNVMDLQQSDQAKVNDGLPTGTFDEARAQLQALAETALPLCVEPAPPVATTPLTTASQTPTASPTTPPDGEPHLSPAPDPTTSPSLTQVPTGPSTAASAPGSPTASPTTTDRSQTSATPSPTPLPQEPGVNCREAA